MMHSRWHNPAFFVFLISFPLAATAVEPSDELVRGACEYVAAQKGDGIFKSSIEQGWIDANNDGQVDEIQIEFQGTSRSTVMTITGISTKAQGDWNYDEDWRWSGWGGSLTHWLNYKGTVFAVTHSDNESHNPTYLWHVDPENKLHKECKLAIKKVVSASTPLCRKLVQLSKEIDNPKDLKNRISIANKYGMGAIVETKGSMSADVFNNGESLKVHNTIFASGSGAGCDVYYYLLDRDIEALKGKTLRDDVAAFGALSEDSKLFYNAQKTKSLRGTDTCRERDKFRIIEYDGITYVTRGVASEELQFDEQLHTDLFYIENGKVIRPCDFRVTTEKTYTLLPQNAD